MSILTRFTVARRLFVARLTAALARVTCDGEVELHRGDDWVVVRCNRLIRQITVEQLNILYEFTSAFILRPL